MSTTTLLAQIIPAQFGIDDIFTDTPVNPSTVIEILEKAIPEFDKRSTYIKSLIEIYKGNQAILQAPDGLRNINEKKVINYIKYIIDMVVAITLSSELSFVPHKNKEEYKADIEIISMHLTALNEHKYNIDTLKDMLTCGVAYQYAIAKRVPAIGNVKEKFFTIGRFAPENTCAVKSYDEGNPVVLSFTRVKIDEIMRYTCFDNKYRYIIEPAANNRGGFTTKDKKRHYLPFNPIQLIENDMYRLSLVADLAPAQDSFNSAISNYGNDILIKINQILVLIGATLNAEQKTALKEQGILMLPAPPQGGANPDAKFVSSQLSEGVLRFIQDIKQILFELGGVPSQNAGRAETGKAVETQNGHTLANFTSNMREYAFITPKRQQLDNIITILKNNKQITSDISSQDIDIKFDRNRLASISESVANLEKMLLNGVDPYTAVAEVKIFENNQDAAAGIKASQEKKVNDEYELKWGKVGEVAATTTQVIEVDK